MATGSRRRFEEKTESTESTGSPEVTSPEPEAVETAPAVEKAPPPAKEEEKKGTPPQVVVGVPKLRRINRNIPHEGVMDVAVFLRREKVKVDHQAGFFVFAKQKNLTRLTLTQWRAEWEAYRTRPVK